MENIVDILWTKCGCFPDGSIDAVAVCGNPGFRKFDDCGKENSIGPKKIEIGLSKQSEAVYSCLEKQKSCRNRQPFIQKNTGLSSSWSQFRSARSVDADELTLAAFVLKLYDSLDQ